jgi:hypothetical protein
MATKKGKTNNLCIPILFLLMLYPRSGIQDKNPESATLVLNLKNGPANNNSEWI